MKCLRSCIWCMLIVLMIGILLPSRVVMSQDMVEENKYINIKYPELKQTSNMSVGEAIYPIKVIESFNEPSSVDIWQKGENTRDIKYVVTTASQPHGSYFGEGMLEQYPDQVLAYEWRSIFREFEEPLDLTEATYLSLAANSWGFQPRGQYLLRIRLYNEEDMYEGIVEVKYNQWDVVFLNIEGWDGKDNVTKMELSFMLNFDTLLLPEGSPGREYWDGLYQIDYIVATSIKDMQFDTDGDTEGFTVSQGQLSAREGKLWFEFDGNQEAYIQSGRFEQDLSSRNTITFWMHNYSETTNMKLQWITKEDPNWDEQKSQVLDIDANIEELSEIHFNLSNNEKWDGTLTQFRLIPLSNSAGKILIDSIRFNRLQPIRPPYPGKIIETKIMGDQETIQINGFVGEEGVTLALYEIPMYEEYEDYDFNFLLTGQQPLKTKVVQMDRTPFSENHPVFGDNPKTPANPTVPKPFIDGNKDGKFPGNSKKNNPEIEFSFEIPLMEGERSRLYSKFVIAVERGEDQYELVDAAQYITNPEILATRNYPFDLGRSKKGIQTEKWPTDAEELGISHVGIGLVYGSMLYSQPPANMEDVIIHKFQGKNYYFRRNYVEELDNQIRSQSDNGVIVTLIPVMYATFPENTPNDKIIHPDVFINKDTKEVHGGIVYAVNTKDEGMEYVLAITDFMAERYSREDEKYGRAVNYVVANEIGQQKVWNNMGPQLIEDYVEYYTRLLRLTHQVLRSHYDQGRVYVSLDHYWDLNISPDSEWLYDNRVIVERINALTKKEGDFPWHIAYHPYPENLMEPKFWNDITAINSFNTPRITFKNLHILEEYVKQEHLLYGDQARRITLTEQGFQGGLSEQEQLNQAAALAYAYYLVHFSEGIDNMINHRHVDFSDAEGLLLGIRAEEEGSVYVAGDKKIAYDVYKYIDTERSLEFTEFALDIIGNDLGMELTCWSQLIPNFDACKLAVRPLPIETSIGTIDLAVIDQKEVLQDFLNEAMGGWSDAEHMRSVTVSQEEGFEETLKANIRDSEKLEYKGIHNRFVEPVDFSESPYFYTQLFVNGVPDTTQRVLVKIKAYSGDEILEGETEIQPNEWETVAIDLSQWQLNNKVERIKIWVKPAEESRWSAGSIYFKEFGKAKGIETLQNIRLNISKPYPIKANDEVAIVVENKGKGMIEDVIILEGVHVQFSESEKPFSLAPGETFSWVTTVTELDIPSMEKAKMKITILGDEYLYDLTPYNIPDVIYDEAGNLVIGDFEHGDSGWKGIQTVSGIKSVTQDSTYFIWTVAPQGQRALEVERMFTDGDHGHAIVGKEFKEPVDFSNHNTLSFSYLSWGGITYNGSSVTLKLTTDLEGVEDYEMELFYPLNNSWEEYTADLSQWEGKSSVTSIEIGNYYIDPFYRTLWKGNFYLDQVRGIKTEEEPGEFKIASIDPININIGETQEVLISISHDPVELFITDLEEYGLVIEWKETTDLGYVYEVTASKLGHFTIDIEATHEDHGLAVQKLVVKVGPQISSVQLLKDLPAGSGWNHIVINFDRAVWDADKNPLFETIKDFENYQVNEIPFGRYNDGIHLAVIPWGHPADGGTTLNYMAIQIHNNYINSSFYNMKLDGTDIFTYGNQEWILFVQ